MLHKCTDAECPFVGQRTDRTCGCHQTDEQVLRDENERLRGVLRQAQDALSEYACHVGDRNPCIRTPDQCRDACGKSAGNAALAIDAIFAEGSAL